MASERTIHLLDFGGVIEGGSDGGSAAVRIDEATAPGRVHDAHAALQPYLATGEPIASDAAGGAAVRVAAMLYDVDGPVVRLRLERTDGAPAREVYEV